MCGIIGAISNKPFPSRFLLERLKRLEYRGYDSFGYYDGSKLKKNIGEIAIAGEGRTQVGIAHTRWATHGGVTEENAHPHMCCENRIAIAHNGIIENFREMRKALEKKGHRFRSQTDSEVVAHYFEEKQKQGRPIKGAISDFFKEAHGTFAILIMVKGESRVYAIKRDSPLVLGLLKDKLLLASDIYAFSDMADKAIFFDNDEFAIVEPGKYSFFDSSGKSVKKEIKEFTYGHEESGKKKHRHFMIKEIEEEPAVAERLLLSLEHEQKAQFEKLVSMVKSSRKLIFAACGTSYHASLIGAYFLHAAGIESHTLIASEFSNYANVDKNTLVIAISQSGETMDVIDALKYAKEQGARVASIVNVPYSTIQRMSELSLNILAGQEVAVASTKAFTNQATLLLALAKEFGYKVNTSNLPLRIRQTVAQKEILKALSKRVAGKKDCYIIGRGQTYPAARESALKTKEISYIHAEGMMGGELKHGTIALIEKGTPVIALAPNNDQDILSNAKEVEARGANLIFITNNPELKDNQDTVYIETGNDGKFSILSCIAGQLLAYYTADALGKPIDKPRNLAKSVTVK